ncbi:MAG: hypothetical protein J5911_04310 [Clostridia bacterium]|nr:hypothetical protein [Clostridia bacterium]
MSKYFYESDEDKRAERAEDFLAERLKKEIDLMLERLLAPLKGENRALKKEISALKAENARLYRQVYYEKGGAFGYFLNSIGRGCDRIQKR